MLKRNVRCGSLTGAKLIGTNLTFADFTDATLTGAKIADTQLTFSKTDETTILPPK